MSVSLNQPHVIGQVVEQANEQVNEQAFDLAKEMADLAQLQAEAMGWLPLEEGVYLHVGSNEPVIHVVGVAHAEMDGTNVLWLV